MQRNETNLCTVKARQHLTALSPRATSRQCYRQSPRQMPPITSCAKSNAILHPHLQIHRQLRNWNETKCLTPITKIQSIRDKTNSLSPFIDALTGPQLKTGTQNRLESLIMFATNHHGRAVSTFGTDADYNRASAYAE